jgi:phenylpropionate dioxygenase-like ring-hydroxylating dioxygenase large terminal subunit
MRALISSSQYNDVNVFDREQAILFRKVWQFAGFGRDLSHNRDYIVTQIGGRSVIVQNFEGDLKCFLNVCSHRCSAIRPLGKGNGLLQCQYHGWVYDCLGIPVGIADFRSFDELTEADRRNLALESWDVERCGEFIFIREGGSGGADLRSWLGEFAGPLENISTSLGDLIDCNRLLIEANWKVAIENTLESYHVRSVHPETFARLGASTKEFRFDDPHSSWSAAIDPAMEAGLVRLNRRLGVTSSIEGYYHLLVFPALTIATTCGMTYSVQYFRPASLRTTELTSYVFAARQQDEEDPRRSLLLEACRPAAEFNRAVFAEDGIICAEMQRGLDQAGDRTGLLSSEERRVFDFQCAWRAALFSR